MKYCLRFVLYVVSGFVTPSQLVIRSPIPSNVRLHSSETSTHVSVRRSERNMMGSSNDGLQTNDAKDANANGIESMLRSHNPSKYTSKMGEIFCWCESEYPYIQHSVIQRRGGSEERLILQ